MTRQSFAHSLLLHSLLLLPLFIPQCSNNGTGDSPGRNGRPDPVDKFIPKPQAAQVPETVSVTFSIRHKQKQVHKSKSVKTCKETQWYGGIGIEQDGYGVIGKIAEGYAADRAGLRVGDRILGGTKNPDIRGPIGTLISLMIMRGSQIISYDLIREKICFE